MFSGTHTQSRGLYRKNGIKPVKDIGEAMRRIASGLQTEKMRLRDFYRGAWPIVNAGKVYCENWATDCLAEHLEAVSLGQIKRLAVNWPPRMGKSFHISIGFPDWMWTEDPCNRFLFSGYSQKLCTRHNLDRRAIIEHEWYQNRWGKYVTLADDQNLKTEFQNSARGHMMTAPVGGSATGSGGNILIIDDIMDPMRAMSEPMREKALHYYDNVLTSRLDDREHGAIIIVEQRLHPQDLTGHVVSEKDGWTHLIIPIEANTTRHYTFPISKKKYEFKKGELLDGRRFNRPAIKELRKAHFDDGAAQLDQDPQSSKGRLFKREYWQDISEIPPHTMSVWSWDTATKKNDAADWSVGARIVLWDRGFLITKIVREKMTFPVLKQRAEMEFNANPTDAILVEDKSSGQQLIQEFQEGTTLPIIATEPEWHNLEKFLRASIMLPQWLARRVWYLKGEAWVSCMIDEFSLFAPGVKNDDQVDAVINGVRYLKNTDIPSDEDSADEEETGIEEGL